MPEVPLQVGGARLDRLDTPVGVAAVVLERADGGDEDDGARRKPADAADDVEELLHAHVRAEAALGDHVVRELEADQVCDQRVVAVRDVRERAAVDEGRLALQGLHEVWPDGVLEEDGHRAGGLQLLRLDRFAVPRVPDRDLAEATPQVGEVARDGRDRHHLGCRGDVEAGLPHVAVGAPAEADDDRTERAVVDVDAAPPADRERVDPQLVPVQEVRLEHGGEQVVGRADRVDVAGEVEVQVLHGDDLRVAAARCAALDPEHGPERGLAQAERDPAADVAETLRERDGRGRLAFTRLRRRDRRDADELGVLGPAQSLEDREVDLRLVLAVQVVLVGLEPGLLGDLRDREERGLLRDFQARRHVGRHQWETAAAASSDTSASL